MPRTIYEVHEAGAPHQPPKVPKGWAYIGETVLSNPAGTWEWVPVNNRVGNDWWLLNAFVDQVDYSIINQYYNRVTLDIFDHTNPDFEDFPLVVRKVAGNVQVLSTLLPDGTDTYVITGLEELTEYEVSLQVNVSDGSTTAPNIKRFTTPKNPVPLAPINLTSPNRTNSWIDLQWTIPDGSSAVFHRVYTILDDGLATHGRPPVNSANGASTARVVGLSPDTRYRYYVVGVNSEGREGPRSNILNWATGHDSVTASGSAQFWANPVEWGSWRPDIGWHYWKTWPTKTWNNNVYQGYWQGDPDYYGPTRNVVTSQESGRYWGCVTYNMHEARVHCDVHYGAGVWQNLNVTRTEIARIYRWRAPGNAQAQYMQWNLTYTNIFDSSGKPPLYQAHRNLGNDADHIAAQDTMKAGSAIDWLRLPRLYGRALLSDSLWGSPVNGICLWRGDHENNYYGTAGYGKWSGHGIRDADYPRDAWRYSDWRILISGDWNFQRVSYKAPYQFI